MRRRGPHGLSPFRAYPTQTASKKAKLKRRSFIAALGASSITASPAAWAAFPERPIKLIVGFSAGSAPDIIARSIGAHLSSSLGQPVVIENKPGAGAQIAAQTVAKAPSDGYTLLIAEPGSTIVASTVYSKLPYNAFRDFRCIAKVTDSPQIFATGPKGPKTLREYLAKARASTLTNVSTFGPGSIPHLMAEMLAVSGKYAMQPVHFRQQGDVVAAIANGDVEGGFVAQSTLELAVQAGKMRPLATTSSKRIPQFPDVPTFGEEGHPSLNLLVWLAIFGPTGLPDDVADRIGNALSSANKDEQLKAKLEPSGAYVDVISGARATSFYQSESARWAEVARVSGFKGD